MDPVLIEVKTPQLGWDKGLNLDNVYFLEKIDSTYYVKNNTRIYHQLQLTMLLTGFTKCILLVHSLHTNVTHDIQVLIDPMYLSHVMPLLEHLYKNFVFPTIIDSIKCI